MGPWGGWPDGTDAAGRASFALPLPPACRLSADLVAGPGWSSRSQPPWTRDRLDDGNHMTDDLWSS